MNILLLASHSVAEYDDIRMFTDLGYDIFCPGGYQNPAEPGESLRPALPDAPYHPDLVEACEDVRRRMGDPGNRIDWAKASLPDEVLDWADVIIVHHFPEQWIGGQWDRIRTKRVIWRTCGQSDPRLEGVMSVYREMGLQIVRYSPKERIAFEKAGAFAGEDALIRFGKYPDDYGPWVGDLNVVGNVTQDMVARGDATGLSYWLTATEGLPVRPAGKGSEQLPGGLGELSYEGMLEYLCHIRTYLYLGTQPASYTLGLMEAMLTGVPIIQAGPKGWWMPDLLEAAALDDERWPEQAMPPTIVAADSVFNDPKLAHDALWRLLDYDDKATVTSLMQRSRAVAMFGIETIGAQWKAFLR